MANHELTVIVILKIATYASIKSTVVGIMFTVMRLFYVVPMRRKIVPTCY